MGVFQFKQFCVDQRDCSMKINTDGVLLGAMADAHSATHIVDVGTGTGVIAMMLAQRFPEARCIGIEIDRLTAERAAKNVASSPFSERIRIVNTAFQDYPREEKAGLIVSNPPFYTDSLRSADHRKTTAKHADVGFFRDFFRFGARGLSDNGRIEIIVPVDLAYRLEALALEVGFVCTKRTLISSFADSEPFRCVLGFERKSEEEVILGEQHFHIYAERGIYSAQYRTLLAPFFLAF